MSECKPWTGPIDAKGYGRGPGHHQLAHRVAYELEHGPIPEGLEIDHLCRNRSCVEVTHLEAVSHRENLLRGDTLPGINARKTRCVHGHPFNNANTHIDREGKRHCRACDRERHREYAKRG